MILRRLIKNKDKRKQVAHIGAAIVILIHSYEKYESNHWSFILFGIAGLVFLPVALLHPVIEKKAPWIDVVFLPSSEYYHLSSPSTFFKWAKRLYHTPIFY